MFYLYQPSYNDNCKNAFYGAYGSLHMAEMKAYDVYERNQTNVINEDGQSSSIQS